jgi:hypothetical protein
LWTIQICNLKPTEKTVELSLNYQQNRKNNLTIKSNGKNRNAINREEVAIIEQIAKEESRSRKSNVKLT